MTALGVPREEQVDSCSPFSFFSVGVCLTKRMGGDCEPLGCR